MATPNGLTGGCGAVVATAGGNSITASGINLAAGVTCAFSVNVSGTAVGMQNDTATVTSATAGANTSSYTGIQVTQGTQTISFSPLPAHTYGNAPFALSATATSGLPVAFSVTSGPCSVSSTALTIAGAGNCVIAASQAGNVNYTAATPVSQTLVTGPALLTVTANSTTVAVGAVLPPLTATITGFVNGDTSAVVTGAANINTTAPAGVPLSAGVYPVTATAGTLAAANYTFVFVNGTLTVTAAPPAAALTAITNAASFAAGTATPNTILTAFGTNLTCSATPQLLINGSAAQVIYAGATQINFVVPGQISRATATIQAACDGSALGTITVPAAQVDPAIFTQTGTGAGQASVVNVNGTVNAAGNPIAQGSYVSVYVTGFGPFNPPGSNGLQTLVYPVTATIGGLGANIAYAGNAPGESSGLQQINIQVPSGAATGPAIPIVLTVDGVATQAGTTIAVQ